MCHAALSRKYVDNKRGVSSSNKIIQPTVLIKLNTESKHEQSVPHPLTPFHPALRSTYTAASGDENMKIEKEKKS